MSERSTIQYKHFLQQLVESIPWPMVIIDGKQRVFFGNGQAGTLFGIQHRLAGKLWGGLVDDGAIEHLMQTNILNGSQHSRGHGRSGPGGARRGTAVTGSARSP